MFTLNLEKELIKQQKSKLSAEQLLVLQEGDKLTSTDDFSILRETGFGYIPDTILEIKNQAIEHKKMTEAFGENRVFDLRDIERLCKKYYLRFLHVHHYAGSIDHELPTKISTLKAAMGEDFMGDNFYIAAPAKSFNLKKRPIDPLCFYRLKRTSDSKYLLVHKWGSDLSIFRRMITFLEQSWVSFLAVLFAITLLVWLPLFLTTQPDICWGVSGGLAAGWTIVWVIWTAANRDWPEDRFRLVPRNSWDSAYY